MKQCITGSITTLAAAILAAAPVAWGESLTDQLATSVREGTVNLNFRYRFEGVDDDAFQKDAWASTLRSRLTLATKPLNGFSALVEFDDIHRIGTNHTFNDTRNGITDRPTIADPKATDLNQAYLRYTGFEGTDIKVGRQRILRNNERFISGSGWRQNEQTFDAISISHKFNDKLTASYAWISQVNRINGPNAGTPPADFNSSTHLFDGSYTFGPALTLAGYAYLMDFSNADAASNQTYGLRGTGSYAINDTWKVPYTAEFATQSDYADNPVNYHANYYLAEVGVTSSQIGIKLGYEVLAGNSTAGKGFRTPLATPHAFQGWADKFAANTVGGLNQGVKDFYVALTGKALGADLLLRFHDFSAETGSADLGTEVDASANWAIGKHNAVLLKGASYDADTFARDTTKYWVMLTANF
ncbi:MAG: alginate export family protein [Gammaproteobacteria bacterium]|nr:alginate export family protein [Gammaproteobacteria bacterium]